MPVWASSGTGTTMGCIIKWPDEKAITQSQRARTGKLRLSNMRGRPMPVRLPAGSRAECIASLPQRGWTGRGHIDWPLPAVSMQHHLTGKGQGSGRVQTQVQVEAESKPALRSAQPVLNAITRWRQRRAGRHSATAGQIPLMAPQQVKNPALSPPRVSTACGWRPRRERARRPA